MTLSNPVRPDPWSIIDSLPDPHILVDVLRDESGQVAQVVVRSANVAALAEQPSHNQDPVGQDLLASDHSWAQVVRACLAQMAAGQPFDRDEIEAHSPDGHRWLDVRALPLDNGYIVTWRDVSSYTDEANATRASQSQLRQVLDALPDPYVLLDPVRGRTGEVTDFVAVELNMAAVGHAQVQREALIGRSLSEVVPAGALHFLVDLCARVSDHGTSVIEDGVSFPGPGPDDDPRLFDIRAVPVDAHVALTWRDVTQRELTVQQLHESEEHYRLLSEQASDIVFRGTPEATVEWVSPSVKEVLGFEPTDLIGRVTTELVHPDDRGGITAQLTPAQGGESSSFRARFLTASGDARWLAVNVRAVLGTNGQVAAWIGSARDVHEAHLAQQALADSEARFRLLAETTSDVVYQTDSNGRIVWMTDAMSPLLGWDPAALIGTPATQLVAPEDLPKVDAMRPGLYEGEPGVEGLVLRALTASGETRYVSVTTHALHDDDGAVVGLVAAVRDVDGLVRARKNAEEVAARLTAQDNTMLDPQVILVADRDDNGRITDFRCSEANRAASAYLRKPREELVGRHLTLTFPDADRLGLVTMLADAVDTGRPMVEVDWPYTRADSGETRWFDLSGARLGDGLTLTWRDVTPRYLAAQALSESEQRYRLLAENSSDVVIRIKDGQIWWVSPSVGSALGGTPDDWVGLSVESLVHPDDRPRLATGVRRALKDGSVAGRGRVRGRDGRYHWTDVTARIYVDAAGEKDGFLASLRVVDDKVAAEEQLRRLAHFDDLTGVWKRSEAVAHLNHLVQDRREPGNQSAVLFIDLDAFKLVNDTAGHAAGDEFLVTMTERMRDVVRRSDLIARIGGDEFLVILDQVRSGDEARQVAEKIRSVGATPIQTRVGLLSSSVSIGITLVRQDDDVDLILARADTAMYEAKRTGRDRFVLFEDMAGSDIPEDLGP